MQRLYTLIVLTVGLAHAQDMPARKAAMQHLQETLSRQTQVEWVQAPTGSDVKPYTVIDRLSDVAVDAEDCTVAFKTDRSTPDYHYQLVLTWKLAVREIDQIVVETLDASYERSRAQSRQTWSGIKTEPAVFGLQMSAAPERKFLVHRWSINSDKEVIEKEQSQSPALITFSEEAIAREAG